MRLLLTILLVISCLSPGFTRDGMPGKNPKIEHLLDRSMYYAKQSGDSAGWYADEAYKESEKAGYTHGIALALACQAEYIKLHYNDFIRSEALARQSLDMFGHTPDKDKIHLAYYMLGFSLFAQSRFDEAIRYMQEAKTIADHIGDTLNAINIESLIGCVYRESGNYERSLEIYNHCLQLSADAQIPALVATMYFQLADLFIQIEDYPAARNYFHMGFDLNQKESFSPWSTMVYAELLSKQHLFDSAMYYYDHFDSAGSTPAILRTYLVSKGEFFLQKGQAERSLTYFTSSLSWQQQLNDRNQEMRCLKDLALAYQRLGQNKLSAAYAKSSLAIAEASNARQYIRDNCHTLQLLYDAAGRTDSAYAFYRRYNNMKDSVNNEQLKGKFASNNYRQQIAMLNKEKELQNVCIREQTLTKKLLIGGIIVLVLLSAITFWIVHLRRKNEAYLRKRVESELEIQRLEGERAKSTLRQRAKELEVQALRSQMNPHFIFNCLNAINRFILGHETEAASDYLTKFSRLMRMTMNHSRHAQITLAEELDMLQLYLDMEKLRFKNAFDYVVSIDDEIEPADISIPPLLLQPFVENAVWHGLLHKKERGLLTILINAEGNMLTCIIKDNGIGRQKAGQFKSKSAEKHKSMGLQITAERLALMAGNSRNDTGHNFTIEDLYDGKGDPAGTQVVLRIRIDADKSSTQPIA